MSQALGTLSACVTRILVISDFTPDLKTRDFQQAFSEWDNINGGYRIKWINDTSLYIVFQDPTIAKRAYLQALHSPPPVLSSPTAPRPVQIRPYDGPDAQSVIQAVNSRGGNPRAHGHRTSVSVSIGAMGGGPHSREGSGKSPYDTTPTQTIPIPHGLMANREPSPTLPNLPTHPALSSLISSSLSNDIAEEGENGPTGGGGGAGVAPRIGDPGKRMVAHSLGMRHPNLTRSHSGGDLSSKAREMQGVAYS